MMMMENTTMRKPVRASGTFSEPVIMNQASQHSRSRATSSTSACFQV